MNDFETLPGFIPRAELTAAFASDRITTPTEAQRLSFEAILAGQNVVINSATGTGKTLAYLLPLLQRLESNENARIVCLAPAAELAVQTLRVANRYKSEALKTGILAGGGNQKKQKDQVQKSTRLIVGTPGRVLEMIAQKKLKGITTFVLDEPEPLLVSKDGAFLAEVLSRPPRPQVILAGATFGANSERLIREFMGAGTVQAKSTDNPLQTRIRHVAQRVRDARDRDFQLLRFVESQKDKQIIVYVNQAHLISHIYRALSEQGLWVATLSQDRTKQQCEKALRQFTDGDMQILVTTDRAATGLDIEAVPWVLHYELPRSTQAFVHRAGRTGRAGEEGASAVLFADDERFILTRLEKELQIKFEDLRFS
jgi:superfamily II DNA/RNA helicase